MTIDSMWAVRLHAFGEPEVLVRERVPRPVPGPGEALVRVHAAGVNPPDWYARRNFDTIPAELRPPLALPLIPGSDISGTVAATGPGSAWEVGERVHGLVNFPGRGAGYAEYATAPDAHLARLPDALDHPTGAALPMAGLTAYQYLTQLLRPAPGITAVVNGAAGGVGHLALQLLRAGGAGQVIAVASGRHRDFLHELGADRFVDYTAGPVADTVRDADLLLDTVGGPDAHRLLPVLRRGGRVAPVFLGDYHREHATSELGLTFNDRFWQVRSSGEDLTALDALVAAGTVRVAVTAVFPLADAAAAHRRAEQGHLRGKLVLHVAD
ncbi:NADPH:quinone reductase-like Zn-dependent oxidoreductase [Kitasatospora sp. SolWspMP-SS2h]|uniref:NADP-dependent oxidoreductase n=1 Tax=Kitasatospora sp. SolWspMP-SS2h TaxID=1305729 RepID=UPI000DB9CB70|nr:NADP-dependent oxidoreductase [Kitasatospora sp. SolWspMP-SS2h]RAJ42193.1 NADPH:quinone reductase-like Zn-dependent oxidoreductase [Kitasatospora sp. SolWspMP-SS2h]